MKDESKTKKQLIKELRGLRQEITELETLKRKSKEEDEELKAKVFLQSSLASAPYGVFLIDKHGRFNFANRTFLKLIGFQEKDIVGKTIQQIVQMIMVPEAAKIIQERAKKRLITGEPIVGAEIEIFNKKGKPIPISYSASGIRDNQGNVVGEVVFLRNLSECKRVDEELRIKDWAIESSINAIALIDLNGNLTYVNNSFIKMWGYEDANKVLGKPAVKFWQKEKKAKEVIETLQNKGSWIGELIARRKDGSLFIVQLLASMVTNDEKKPICMVASFIDITKRKDTEEVLKESEQNFRDLADNASDGILIALGKGTHVYANHRAAEIAGYSVTELLKTSIQDLAHPDDVKNLTKRYRKRIKEEHAPPQYETRIMRKEGKSIPIELTAAKTTWQGQPADMIIFRDITERKQVEKILRESEERYRKMFENMSNCVAVYDAVDNGKDFIFKDFNKAAERADKIKKNDLIGKSVVKMFPGIKDFGLYDVFKRVWKTGKPQHHPISFYQDNRLTGWRDNYVYKLPSGELVAIYEDVTKRKQAEEKLKEYSEKLEEMVNERTRELQDAQKQLVQREKLAILGQLAGGVGHDLRNPLGAIKNAAYFLNMALEDPKPEVKEILEILQREVENCEKIISSLLDYARPKPPIRQKVDINHILKETLSRVTIPKNIKVTNRNSKKIPTILGDPVQLKQIFTNLILNAIQAMPKGGKLNVTSKLVNHQRISVYIADTGVGISKDNLKKLFEPLFTTKAKGIGLGLAITKILAEGHGASIKIKSKRGKGSTFTIKLPIDKKEG